MRISGKVEIEVRKLQLNTDPIFNKSEVLFSERVSIIRGSIVLTYATIFQNQF